MLEEPELALEPLKKEDVPEPPLDDQANLGQGFSDDKVVMMGEEPALAVYSPKGVWDLDLKDRERCGDVGRGTTST